MLTSILIPPPFSGNRWRYLGQYSSKLIDYRCTDSNNCTSHCNTYQWRIERYDDLLQPSADKWKTHHQGHLFCWFGVNSWSKIEWPLNLPNILHKRWNNMGKNIAALKIMRNWLMLNINNNQKVQYYSTTIIINII